MCIVTVMYYCSHVVNICTVAVVVMYCYNYGLLQDLSQYSLDTKSSKLEYNTYLSKQSRLWRLRLME